MRKSLKAVLIVLGVSIGVLACVIGYFLLIANHYKTHFFPGTTMSGIDVSEMTVEEATAKVTDNVQDYLLTLYTRDDEKFLILGPDIAYTYVPNGEIGEILEAQNVYDWIAETQSTREREITLSTWYDEEMLEKVLTELPFMQKENIEKPEDAYMEWSDEENNFVIIPEKLGNKVRPKKLLEKVNAAVTEGATVVQLDDSDYVEPEVYSDDETLNGYTDNLKKYFATSITYTFGDEEPYKVPQSTISSWLSVDENNEIVIDDVKITNFVQYLATTYNTYGDTRKFKTAEGDKVNIGGGDYGWVVDKVKEKEQIYKDLESTEPVERDIVYSQRALYYGIEDIGKTYVEVDYTNQHIYYFKKGKLVLDSDVVTGNINRGNGSPDGVFKIVYKEKDATLVGEGYSSPVKFFMPFAYNVGFHDASWRSNFGGEIYKTNGSHGCVNCPKDVAETLYDKLEVGTPVVAYYRDKVKLTAENARISNAYSYVAPEE